MKHYPDYSALELEILAAVGPCTMTSSERVVGLVRAVEYLVTNAIPGDIVECGVWKGGSSMAAALALQAFGDTSRELLLFDTFQGMTTPTESDVDLNGAAARPAYEAALTPDGQCGWCSAMLDEVRANMASTGYPAKRVRFVPGPVEGTIPAHAPGAIALLRLDTDWYESTRHELNHLYPRLARHGVLIIDDYGHWKGARKAVDDYFQGLSPRPLLTRMDYTGRLAVKP
ncbi:TylF/MycF/NovP-related O-methyltransferase [Humidesulfovibrio sp.]